jgi:CheY-like chemotaxis protein/HPt (histidine-containing phosphotransfer) domain-containing protein/two-component sensor histidine kinase
MTGLLLDTELTTEQRHYAELTRASGESLLQLINDILDLSKIEAKKLELETIDFDLRILLDNLASILFATANAKGIKLLCGADLSVPTQLRGDPGRLRQILTNLVANAIKFTEKGEVEIRVALEEENESNCVLRFSVCDTGIGIPEDKIGALFNKFSQVEASTTRKYGGSGLGLAISRQLAELMGGGVGVKSLPGKGSEFWFTARLGISLGLGEPDEGAQPEDQTTVRLNGRILIAEDNSTNREVALGMLRNLGLRADAVANGAEAIRALESIPYDLVLMDMRMPVMDGIEAARQIRNPQSAVLEHDIPIIALTADAMQSDRDSCQAAGMNDFVPKPILKSVLRAALKRWLCTGNAATPSGAPQVVPSTTAADTTLIFDLEGMLGRLDGDNELAAIVIAVFLEDIPAQIQTLKDFVKSGDTASSARQAHSIRGASANVGGDRLRNVASVMEKAADVGDLHAVAARMADLELEFDRLRDAMKANK